MKNKIPISKKDLIEEYKTEANQLLDNCDWITEITSEITCEIVCAILINKGFLIEWGILHQLYKLKIKELNITDEEYRKVYADWDTGVPKLIEIIYEIIENKFGSSE